MNVRAFICGAVSLCAGSVWGVDRWVAPGGTNTIDCIGSPCGTIRTAHTLANAGDRIVLAAGTYTESNLVFNKSITLQGAGPDQSIVQAAPSPGVAGDRILTFSPPTPVTCRMAHVTFRNGRSTSTGGGQGGAILTQAPMSISNCWFVENHSSTGDVNQAGYEGGAIYSSTSLYVSASRFISNYTGNAGPSEVVFGLGGGAGGAIYMTRGHLRVESSAFLWNRTGMGSIDSDNSSQNGEGGAGGAIAHYLSPGETLVVSNCVFLHNATGDGGGQPASSQTGGAGGAGGAIFFTSSATALVVNCVLVSNQTGRGGLSTNSVGRSGAGGALWLGGQAALVLNCRLTDNQTGAGSDGHGGGLYASLPALTLSDCEVARNHTGDTSPDDGGSSPSGAGGGLYALDVAALQVERCTFDRNFAGTGGGAGGGVKVISVAVPALTNRFLASTFSRNRAGPGLVDTNHGYNAAGGLGGGLDLQFNMAGLADTLFQHCTISSNEAGPGAAASLSFPAGSGGSGGGLNVYAFTAGLTNQCRLEHCTIAYNRTGAGGAGAPPGATGAGGGIRRLGAASPINAVTLYHTALALNQGSSNAREYSGDVASLGYNLVFATNTTALAGVTNGNLLGVDPLLGPLQDNGGLTETHDFAASTPLQATGDPALPFPPVYDQRGGPRVVGVIDIGAVERVNPGNDFDGDDVPTLWELFNGMDPVNPADVGLDTDGDGSIGGDEYVADTHAGDPADYWRFEQVAVTNGIGAVGFNVSTGRVYTLQRILNLVGGTWVTVGGVTNPPGENTSMILSDPDSAGVNRRNYRVIVQFAP